MDDDWNRSDKTSIGSPFFSIMATFFSLLLFGSIYCICFRCWKCTSFQDYRRQRNYPSVNPLPSPNNSSPVVVTTTTIPVPSGTAPNTIPGFTIPGFQYPQSQPEYPHAQAEMYPNQSMPQPYAIMPQPHVDYNPPSYDQVVRGGEAYQKQAPYNPKYTEQ